MLRDQPARAVPSLARGGQGGSGEPITVPPRASPPPPTTAPRLGLLTLHAPTTAGEFMRVEVLSPTDDLREAAANFFAALRRLDAAGLDLIVADLFPETGLGRALNDRLRRAAHS